MIKSIKKTVYFSTVHINKVEIIDTIYQREVDSITLIDSSKLKIYRRELKELNIKKDSLRRIPNKNFGKIFDDIRQQEFKIEIVSNREDGYNQINFYLTKNEICGYKILIYYNDQIDKFIISKDYKLICPAFILDTDDDKPLPPHLKHKQNNGT